MKEFFLGIIEITAGMSLLILVMLLGLKLIGGKFTVKCRYILWALVMIRLAIPFSFGILPALIELPVETEPEPVQVQIQTPVADYTPMPQNPVTMPPQEQVQMPSPPVQTPVFTEPEPEPITWDDVKVYIPHAWLTGAAVFLLWNLLSYWIYTAKILRTAREADVGTQEIYEAVCRKKGLSHPPVLLVSPDVNSPAAFGLIRRRIVLPEIDFTENGLAGTLSHEVTHCKRGDLWIKAVCLLARALHWFNPLVHLSAFRCEMEMELSCDESVLAGCDENTRAAYGEVMLDIIKRCRRNRGALTTHFNPRKNAVKARFTNILYGSGKKRGLWLIAVCLVLCLIAGAIVACRTEGDDVQETLTEPLPDGETVEIPLIYKQYTPELSQDMFVEEIQETELTEILQDQELCGVRVILYLDENELFCAAYERDDTLFRFIRTGGVEPVSYAAEEFSDILEADGFTVSWSWSHRFRAYFTVEDDAPELYLDAYDNVTEADYDNDGVTEVICQSMISVAIYDIADGVLQTVAFDSELIQPKPGEFYRYLPEKNWFEFDYKKDGDDTLYHRYGVVEDDVLTLVTPENDEEDTVSSSPVNILSQNSDLQVHTVYIPVDGQNPEYIRYSLGDRYTIFQTYDRTDRWAEERIADNIMLWVVDALTGTIAASFNADGERIFNEISYTDTGCVLYRWENQNGIIVAGYAVQIENTNGAFTFAEISMDAYPQKLNYVRTPDGTASAYRTVEDIDGNHGIDVKYANGTVKRILTGTIGSVQSTVGYRPIAFLDDSHLVYSVSGGKYHISFGIYNIDTHENMLMDGAYRCLGVHDGVVYAAYENGGDFDYGIYESELWAIHADGTKNMLAATHNVPDGIKILSMEEYYLFKNGMWVFYETGDISGYTYYDDPSEKLKVRLVSPDLQTTLLEAEYPYVYDCTGLLMTCGDSVTIAVPVTTEETVNTGTYPTMEAYVADRMAKETTAQYYSYGPDGESISNQSKTANVTDTKLLHLEKKGELADLAPEGVLECWEYKYLIKLDVPAEEVVPVGGQEVEDGWFDLEGQNGHTTVALRYPDGTYTVLRDENIADRIDFTGYRNSYEEAIYDWYVTEYALALPLYVEEWGDLITPPEGERIGNTPVHRFDGDGWGIYIPVQAWYSSTDAMENQWLWRSSYNTGSKLIVDVFSHSLEDEYVTAEKQGYMPADSTKRVWENHTDGLHSCYYYYENPNGGFWRVIIEWTDEGVTNDNANIVIEPQILKLMAEKFVVFGAGNSVANAVTVTSPIYLCDDVYRSETTPTHGKSTITFPDGLNGYKLYTCEVLLCGDGCDPHDVVWRNFFGYAGGYDLQEMELTRTGSYPTKLYLMEYPEDIVAQILSDMEKGGASEEEKLAYRNRRWYLYLLTLDADHYACIFLEPENMAARPDNEQEILDALIASVAIGLSLSEPEVELVSYPYTDRVFPVPEYWEEEQIAVLEYSSNTTPAFSFALYEWRAHTEHDTGLVWILSAHTLEEFAETAEFWKNTHDIDVYTQIFSQANYLLGTDTEYAYVLTLPTDVQFLEKDPVSYQQYERLQISSQTVLGWFMEENGITPNPTCPASAVYAPAEETPEGIASAFLNRYLHQVYTYTETAFTEMMDPAYHTPIAYLQDKAQYLSYTRQARGEMAYDFDVEYYNTQTTNPAENFKACSIRASIRFRKEPYGEMVNLEERYIVTLRETETGWLVTDMMQENDRFDEMYKANGFDLNALLTEFDTSLAGNPDTIWQTFLDTVVAPYEENISSKEFLDLDGNGIEELLLFDLGNGICEIYTIEGGDVRCLYTGQQGSGHSLLTIYHDNPTMLAPPSLGAGEYVFYASGTPEDVSKTRYKNWFIPSPKTGGYVLYSTYGNTVSRTDQYFHFYSGEDAVLGKVLCVAELSRFELEAINSNPALGWECWHQGEKVTKSQYMDRLEECWNVLEETYGVTYTEEDTNHHLDELRKTVDTSFELLADLLDTLKTEDPQAYIARGLYGEIDSANRYAAWGFYDDNAFAESLAVNYTFEPLTAMEVQETAMYTLYSPTEDEWMIQGWVNSSYIELVTGGQSYFFRAAHKNNSEIYFGDTLKNWFDDAEYAATSYQAVIPDTGQGFLTAAQTFVESWYGRNLQVSSGSEHAFSYVSCSVRDAQNRDHLIENGFIGENTYTYYITVIFVPENPHAGRGLMATVAGPYSGEDPAVPANAYEFQLNGYITLEEDGWHGEVGGTGW